MGTVAGRDQFGIMDAVELRMHREQLGEVDYEILELLGGTYFHEDHGKEEGILNDLVTSRPDLSDFLFAVIPDIFSFNNLGREMSFRLLELFADRFRVVDEIGGLKRLAGKLVRDVGRELLHIDDLCNRYPESRELILELYPKIFKYSRLRQENGASYPSNSQGES